MHEMVVGGSGHHAIACNQGQVQLHAAAPPLGKVCVDASCVENSTGRATFCTGVGSNWHSAPGCLVGFGSVGVALTRPAAHCTRVQAESSVGRLQWDFQDGVRVCMASGLYGLFCFVRRHKLGVGVGSFFLACFLGLSFVSAAFLRSVLACMQAGHCAPAHTQCTQCAGWLWGRHLYVRGLSIWGQVFCAYPVVQAANT
jgi:hypothetical protein